MESPLLAPLLVAVEAALSSTFGSACNPVLPSGGWNLGCGAEVVGSGFVDGGCDAVLGLSLFCVEGEVLSGWPWGGCEAKETGVPDMARERRARRI